jgi:hypothetical protein
MPVPISIILYDKGAAGVPTTTNGQPLRGVDAWEHVTSDRYGFETARAGWNATRAGVLEWARADHLNRHMEAYSPDGKRIWEGRLVEIAITVGRKKLVFSLKDMANRLKLRYTTDAGAQAATSAVSSTASIAMFGTKDRLLNLSTVSATAAANRIQTALGQIAFPTSKQSSASGSGENRGDVRIELTFAGWYGTLDELLTSSSSTTTTATGTQVASLLTAYNSTNAFFNSSTSIVATGVSDTEYIDDDSTYREKIETLLAHGNSSQQRLAWGVYEERRFVAAVWAGATPATITYYEYEASGEIRDGQGNIVPPWEVRPNAMAQLADVLDTAPDGAVESPTRKYVARVHCTIRDSGASVTLEPDNVDSLEALLSSPSGGGPSGTSDRQAAFERKVTKPARTRFSGTNGTVDAGGGTVSNTGGGTVDLGTGSGIGGGGSSGVTTTGGTTGRVAEWATSSTLQASTLIKSGAGVLTLSAASSLTLTLSGGSGQLDFTTPTSGDALIYDGAKFTPTAAPSGNGTTGRVAKWTSSTALGADTLIKSGAGVLTLSASTTETLTIGSGGGGTLDLNGGTLTLGPDLTTSGAGATITLSSSGAFTLTIPATGTAALGTGTSNRIAYWSGTNTLTSSANLTYNGTVMTLGTGTAAANTTLTIRGGSTAVGTFSIQCLDSAGVSYFSVQNNGVVSVDTGPFWVNGGQVLTGQKTGWSSPTGTATRTTFATSTVTLQVLAEHVKALIDDLNSAAGGHGIIGP